MADTQLDHGYDYFGTATALRCNAATVRMVGMLPGKGLVLPFSDRKEQGERYSSTQF
ncbi:MAG: hypothetical protein V4714_14000 [Bacteroidota bacterium]